LKAHERARELTKTEHVYLLRASGHAAGTTQVKAHGIQCADYASKEYQLRVKNKSITMSMSRKGTPADNAPIESFHASLKCETF
ncbi:IS3 family transposase, partial [Erysipelothrix rhusiopathiae]|nr:IS3 family transposase [Erysipelothrix rhusiopathiae]